MLKYLFFLGCLSFAATAFDKFAAKSFTSLRVRENTLHLLELAGGCYGSLLACVVFRHKTRKFGFIVWTVAFVIGWTLYLISTNF